LAESWSLTFRSCNIVVIATIFSFSSFFVAAYLTYGVIRRLDWVFDS